MRLSKSTRFYLVLAMFIAIIAIIPTGTAYADELNPLIVYGKDMGSDRITLYVDAPDSGEATYQWQVSDSRDDGFENLVHEQATSRVITFAPEEKHWYRCKRGEEYSPAIMTFKNGTTGVNSLKRWGRWYLSNDTMAYGVNGNEFDILGKYVYTGSTYGTPGTYWMNTSYGPKWYIVTGGESEPGVEEISGIGNKGSFESVRFSFSEENPRFIRVDCTLAEGFRHMAIGTDTMLGNTTITRYSDNASLKAIIEGDKLTQIQMVAAKSLDDAVPTDPAFVFRPVTPVDYFWIGAYSQDHCGRSYTYNYGNATYNRFYRFVEFGGENIVNEVCDKDSSMSASWVNCVSGGAISFEFSIGSVAETGAITKASVTATAIVVDTPEEGYYYALFDKEDNMVSPWSDTFGSDGKLVFPNLEPDSEYFVKQIKQENYNGNPSDPSQNDPSFVKSTKALTALSFFKDGSGIEDAKSRITTTETGLSVRELNPDYIYVLTAAEGYEVARRTPDENGILSFDDCNLEPGTEYILRAEVMDAESGERRNQSENVVVRTQDDIVIDDEPHDNSYNENETNKEKMSVLTRATSGAACTVKWYQNTERSSNGATLVQEASTDESGRSYLEIPSDLKEGVYHYYAEISAPGLKPKTTRIATVNIIRTSDFTVKVMRGETPVPGLKVSIGSQNILHDLDCTHWGEAREGGEYFFANAPDGFMSITVWEAELKLATQPFVKKAEDTSYTIVLPEGDRNALVTSRGDKPIYPVVADLTEIINISDEEIQDDIEDDKGITKEDIEAVTGGGEVLLKLYTDTPGTDDDTRESIEKCEAEAKINFGYEESEKIKTYKLDISLEKIVKTQGEDAGTTTPLKELNYPIDIFVTLPEALERTEDGRDFYFWNPKLRIFRVHDDIVEELPKYPNKNAYGEYFELIDNNRVAKLTLKRFSIFTFAVPYDKLDEEPESEPEEKPHDHIITEIRPYDIEVSISEAELCVGESLLLDARVLPYNAYNQSLIYTSSDEQVATVTGKGEITAVGEGEAVITITTFNGFTKTVKVVVNLPESEDDEADGKTPENNEAEKDLAKKVSQKKATKIRKSIDTSEFNRLRLHASTNSEHEVTISWREEAEADGYMIYGSKCNVKHEKHKMKYLMTVSADTLSATIGSLESSVYHKFVVVAYKLSDGERVAIAKTPIIHTSTKDKYGAETAVLVEKVGRKTLNSSEACKVYMRIGKSRRIRATEIREDKPFKHHRDLAFESTDTSVATVAADGTIRAVGKGKCTILVYAQNGVYNSIRVVAR